MSEKTTVASLRIQNLDSIIGPHEPVEWLIKGTLPRQSLVLLYGPTGIGKTFLMLDLALHLAAGRTWPSSQPMIAPNKLDPSSVAVSPSSYSGVPVLYWIGEGELSARARVKAWVQKSFPDLPLGAAPPGMRFFFLGERQPNLLLDPQARPAPQDTKPLPGHNIRKLIQTLQALKSKGENAPAPVFIVDTISATHPGMEENDARATGTLIENCREIIERTGSTVILVHHSGKNRSGGPRGHSRLTGDPDVILHLTRLSRREGNPVVKLHMEKQRMARPAADRFFELSAQGGDDNVPTLQYLPTGPSSNPTARRPRRLSKRELSTLQVLKAALALADKCKNRSFKRKDVVAEIGNKMSSATVYAKLKELDKVGLLHTDDKKAGHMIAPRLKTAPREIVMAMASVATMTNARSNPT